MITKRHLSDMEKVNAVKAQVEMVIQNSNLMYLKSQIDKALDMGDQEQFINLTNQLNKLIEKKDENETSKPSYWAYKTKRTVYITDNETLSKKWQDSGEDVFPTDSFDHKEKIVALLQGYRCKCSSNVTFESNKHLGFILTEDYAQFRKGDVIMIHRKRHDDEHYQMRHNKQLLHKNELLKMKYIVIDKYDRFAFYK